METPKNPISKFFPGYVPGKVDNTQRT